MSYWVDEFNYLKYVLNGYVFEMCVDGMKFYVLDNKVVFIEGFDGVVLIKYFKNVVKKLFCGREMLFYLLSN